MRIAWFRPVRSRPGRRRRPSGRHHRRARRRARDRVRRRAPRARLRLAARARRLRPVRLRTRQHGPPSVHVAVPAPLSRRARPAVGHRARRAARAAGARGPAGRLPSEIQFAGGPSQVRPPVAHGARTVADAPDSGHGVAAHRRRRSRAGRGRCLGDARGGGAHWSPPAWRTGAGKHTAGRATAHALTIALAEPSRGEVAQRAVARLSAEGVAIEVAPVGADGRADVVVAVRWPLQGRPLVSAVRAMAAGLPVIVAETHGTAALAGVGPADVAATRPGPACRRRRRWSRSIPGTRSTRWCWRFDGSPRTRTCAGLGDRGARVVGSARDDRPRGPAGCRCCAMPPPCPRRGARTDGPDTWMPTARA